MFKRQFVPSSFKALFAILFVFASRGVGMARELVIAAGFGFSRQTDLFYQLSAISTYGTTLLGGPFTTALATTVGRAEAGDAGAAITAIARRVALIGIAASCAAVVFVFVTLPEQQTARIALGILTAFSLLATISIGFSSAVLNTYGEFSKAQFILFLSNASFVAAIVVFWVFGVQTISAVYLLLLFGTSAAIGSLVSRRWMRRGENILPSREVMSTFYTKLRFASFETLIFILNQAVVLYCASISTTGTVSAASLAQRIAFSFNGLVVAPVATMFMVKLSQNKSNLKYVRLGLLSITLCLAAVALALWMFLPTVFSMMGGKGNFSRQSVDLVIWIFPGYCIWLVAQGVSATLARVMFALDEGRIFTILTSAGYCAASLARYFTAISFDFSKAILVGAVVELCVALALAASVSRGQFYRNGGRDCQS